MTFPSTAGLRQILAFTEKREALLAEVALIEARIEAAWGNSASARPTKKVSLRPMRGQRGRMIIELLQAKGESGMAVKDLAAALCLKPQKIHAWLNMTGKKAGLVESVERGVYRLRNPKRRLGA